MKRVLCLTMALMALTLSLTSCSLLSGKKAQTGYSKPMSPESSQSASSDKSSEETASPDKSSEETSLPDKSGEEAKEQKTIKGVINRLGTYLVLLTEDGEYQVMDYGEGVTADDWKEGDKVEITYTGELGTETETPVIVSIAKAD